MSDEVQAKRSSLLWDWFHRANKATWYWRLMFFYIVLYATASGLQSYNTSVQDISGEKWQELTDFDRWKAYRNAIIQSLIAVIAFISQTAAKLSEEKKQKDEEAE